MSMSIHGSDYINKVESILADLFIIGNISCNNLVIQQLKSVLKACKSKSKTICIIYDRSQYFCALPKIHKYPLTRRSMLSSTNSPQHYLRIYIQLIQKVYFTI